MPVASGGERSVYLKQSGFHLKVVGVRPGLVSIHHQIPGQDAGCHRLERWKRFLSLYPEIHDPGKVVDPTHVRLDLILTHTEQRGQVVAHPQPLVAQADGPDSRLSGHGPAQRGHGIGVVEQPGAGAVDLHLPGDVHHDRNVAQSPRQAARTNRIPY